MATAVEAELHAALFAVLRDVPVGGMPCDVRRRAEAALKAARPDWALPERFDPVRNAAPARIGNRGPLAA